jgi:hypothetical protein
LGWPKRTNCAKYREIIADNLKKAGWSLGYVSAVDTCVRTIWIADAHRTEKRFIVYADEKLTAFVELESAIRAAQRLAASIERARPANITNKSRKVP